LSLFLAAAIVLALATIASRKPARRASRVEPSAALRDE
jgi:ABC-type lipoprotein release transport system permease subunit